MGRERPRVEVHDLGGGFVLDPELPEPAAARGRGLFLVNAIADHLARESKRNGGSKVCATLPVRRKVAAAREVPHAAADPPPALGELVYATRRAQAGHRRVVLVTGSGPIDRVLAVSGIHQALETTADPAALDH